MTKVPVLLSPLVGESRRDPRPFSEAAPHADHRKFGLCGVGALPTTRKPTTGLAFTPQKPNNKKSFWLASLLPYPDAEERVMTQYSSLCDDFGIYVYTNTKMELPNRRETVLHFFDGLQK